MVRAALKSGKHPPTSLRGVPGGGGGLFGIYFLSFSHFLFLLSHQNLISDITWSRRTFPDTPFAIQFLLYQLSIFFHDMGDSRIIFIFSDSFFLLG